MEVFRLARDRFAGSLSGKGAALKGARWNSIGVELIYTAANRSLAMAEVAVHFTLATLPNDYMMITIEIPDDIAVKELEEKDLPTHWNAFLHPMSTQNFGDMFVAENEYCAVKVPSVVTQGDYNFLLNPNHPDFAKVRIKRIEKFPFDNR
ncbi:RES family NAD+ phosphorylase [Sphingobacterium wenxiniae]|uniref:RES domain-containing protein n=1 Tax=Sphingobacterium wenxiniae TaxID=683125 RepID=A0A1I6P8J1_9SPHI|nr:RES family NAD+ phosphorylase [Sphingobacterium wenxiniae]SFS36486.1 RES domain-containing protein [Sphingobacterium wenxiniae]